MTITVTAFGWVPEFAQGLVRDLRVRWALEEAGLAYQARLITPDDQNTDWYRALQPFGQVPAYQEDDFTMFESGAIVLHVAERSEALMPRDPAGRARTQTWLLAALNSIEPYVAHLVELDIFYAGEPWAQARRPGALEAVNHRLADLARRLEGREYLEDRFSAGDLMMSTVLRMLRHTDVLQRIPVLDAYRKRCEARPAFQRALADHLAPFESANAQAAGAEATAR